MFPNIPRGCRRPTPPRFPPAARPSAEKAEGVVQSQYRPNLGGKGNVAMAGGGGNCLEGGGGGGANRGDGGNGGKPVLGIGAGGFGGVGIDYSLLERLSMGGGGGAGEQKNGQASSGGFGGGAILVRAGSLTGTGKIESNGDTAQNSGILGLPPFVESDGAGGGGAGGSIFVRLVGNADCSGVNGRGGNGGNTDVLGISLLGAGGGGGGGRVLFQASAITSACVIDTSAGTAGNEGNGGSQAGDPGGAETPPPGGFCFDNGGVIQQCADPVPVCDVPTGTCQKCSGPFGGGTDHACPVATEPVCESSGSCVPCNGDLGTNATQTCQLATSPYCFLTGTRQGECGKCTTNEQVKFKFDSAVILKESDPLLDAVRQVFVEHPEIKRVRVEGHTDNVGQPAYNKTLSGKRAASVAKWLADHGIAKDRLVSQGFGMDMPLDTNSTPEGRANNRRVNFVILEKAEKEEAAKIP